MRRFREEEVEQLLRPADAIAALQRAFSRCWTETVEMPVRMHMHLGDGATLLIMPCSDHALSAAGMKLVTVRENIQAGGTRVQAVFLALSPRTGELQAVLDANYLTAIRTAAVSAVATRVLSPPGSRALGIFGTGAQAWAHVSVLPLIRDFKQVLVCGSSPARSREFAQRAASTLGVDAFPADPVTCVCESDVLCTCTTSALPLFDGRLARPGTHLNLVGAFQPETREVDEELMRRARIVVDTYEGALAEAGDIIIPLRMRAISQDAIADLHQVLAGRKPGRTSPEDITVFKSVGCAFEDLVVARLVYETAAQHAAPVH